MMGSKQLSKSDANGIIGFLTILIFVLLTPVFVVGFSRFPISNLVFRDGADFWTALAAIGQYVEAFVVVFGAGLIFWQLRQIRSDVTQARWNSLQWAIKALEEIEEPLNRLGRPQPRFASRTLPTLNLIQLAIDDGYLDAELFLQSQGSKLAKAYNTIQVDSQAAQQSDQKPAILNFLDRPTWDPASRLLLSASRWWIDSGFTEE
jgi:hypothetical protein